MNDIKTFKQVKSIVFGKNDEKLYNELISGGYFDRNWNNKVKELIRADFYGHKERSMPFTEEQEAAIVDIIKKHIQDIKTFSSEEALDEVVVEKEVIDKSKEAIQALNNLQKFRKK